MLSLACIGIILFIYRAWFLYPQIIGGDWPYYYNDYLKGFSLFPVLWAPWLGGGLGSVQQILGLHFFGSSIVVLFHQWLQIPWNIVYKIGWFGLFIALCVFGSKKLWEVVSRQQIAESREQMTGGFPWWIVASLVYTTNTYILMVTGGGQMGVALSYAMAPIVLAGFIKLIASVNDTAENVKNLRQWRISLWLKISNIKYSLIAGLLLGVQLMIDPRIAYVTMVGVSVCVVSSLVSYFVNKKEHFFQVLVSTFIGVGFSAIIATLLNAFWIAPMVVTRSNPIGDLGSAYTSIESVKFYSFADFSHALSLLHPNWPENLFGKTYFLQPEFLVLPLLAFSSLLYWRKEKNIFFYVFFGLIGVFLSKGAQEPFGIIYQWMFSHVPGFVMFRDPTKWYVLTALSYSVLIPFSFEQFAIRKRIKIALIILFLLFWLFTNREATLGKLRGTFAKHEVPQEYRDLERFLQVQTGFSRTLWVPRQQWFSYGTLDHMPVEAEPLFSATTAAELKTKLDEPTSQDRLADLGIGYVMIPYDSLGELFLTDRKYDEKKRQEYETVLDGVEWLTKIRSGRLTVYQTSRHRDLFWLSGNESLSYRRIRPDQYAVSFTLRAPATVFFSQSYHPGWVLKAGKTMITSQKPPQGLNSFQIMSPGSHEGIVEFEPQKYVTWGVALSILTAVGVVFVFMLPKKDKSLYN